MSRGSGDCLGAYHGHEQETRSCARPLIVIKQSQAPDKWRARSRRILYLQFPIIIYNTKMPDDIPVMGCRPPPPIIKKFDSPEGRKFIKDTLRPLLPYEPHDDQLAGVAKSLDGHHLIATARTGYGKTTFLVMYILMLRALAADPWLCSPPRQIAKDPAMVVVCPTIAIEDDMVMLS